MSRTSTNPPSPNAGDPVAEDGYRDDEEDEEEVFVYPGFTEGAGQEKASAVPTLSSEAHSIPAPQFHHPQASPAGRDAPPALVPHASTEAAVHPESTANSTPSLAEPSPAQLEALYAAASSGDLPLLKRTIQNAAQSTNVEPFSLVNGASSRTGLTALHAASSRGYLNTVNRRKLWGHS
ncbi:hypothetical protein FA95DRAFT_849563 [Auriscalpium vulgare]|uniref:Uncharacterized protein n=1 Tax=Auriscalpium vulgare TaxID=40419 RepID=A0ACB8S0K7_9AGAM|nr:hypothetical protein FA95DRAFT_849563 [Auriscalpium vulgare]